MKKFLGAAFLCALVFTIGCVILPTEASAAQVASGQCYENAFWTLNDNGMLIISGSGSMGEFGMSTPPWESYKLTVPVKQVVIQNGITSIGRGAFVYCDTLEKVTIGDSVTYIGPYAFGFCSNLSRVKWPNHLKTVDEAAFVECTKLTELNLPNEIENIGDMAFRSLGIKTLTLPESVKSVSSNAFMYCPLESVIIKSADISIDAQAFFGCNSLWHVLFTSQTGSWTALEKYDSDGNPLPVGEIVHYGCTGNEITDLDNKKCTICTPECSHSWGSSTITRKATCKEEGEKTFVCSLCKETKTEALPKLTTHDYTRKVTQPTCLEKGYTTYTCSVCGDSYTDNEKKASGHDFDKWYEVKPSTLEECGIYERACKDCGFKEQTEVAKLAPPPTADPVAPDAPASGDTGSGGTGTVIDGSGTAIDTPKKPDQSQDAAGIPTIGADTTAKEDKKSAPGGVIAAAAVVGVAAVGGGAVLVIKKRK